VPWTICILLGELKIGMSLRSREIFRRRDTNSVFTGFFCDIAIAGLNRIAGIDHDLANELPRVILTDLRIRTIGHPATSSPIPMTSRTSSGRARWSGSTALGCASWTEPREMTPSVPEPRSSHARQRGVAPLDSQ